MPCLLISDYKKNLSSTVLTSLVKQLLTRDKVEFNYKLPEFLNQTKTQKNENLIEKPEAGYERRKAILDRGCSVLQTIQVSYSSFWPYQ